MQNCLNDWMLSCGFCPEASCSHVDMSQLRSAGTTFSLCLCPFLTVMLAINSPCAPKYGIEGL
jgi:hypothetical protein